MTNSGLQATRDYKKTLCTKMMYNKRNAAIFMNPDIYAAAIYEGVKSECASQLIEDILYSRMLKPTDLPVGKKYKVFDSHNQVSQTDYILED